MNRASGPNGKKPSEDDEIISNDAMGESVLQWEAAFPYEPDAESDFPAFYRYVLTNLRTVVEDRLAPRLPDNPTLVRMRARDCFRALWWINGVLTEAEDYLTSAEHRAVYLDNLEGLAAPEARKVMALAVSREKRLVTYLGRVRETIIKEVSYHQSDLGFIKEDMKMTGAEDSRTYGA